MKEINPIQYLCNDNYYRILAAVDPRLTKSFIVENFSSSDSKEGTIYIGDDFRKNVVSLLNFKTLADFRFYDGGYSDPSYAAEQFRNHVCENLSDSPITPVTSHCVYRKLSGKVSKFLLGLGRPSEDLVIKYRESLVAKVASSEPVTFSVGARPDGKSLELSDTPVYEEMLSIPINGKSEYFYLAAGKEFFLILHQRAPKRGEGEYMFKGLLPESIARVYRGVTELSYDESYLSPDGRTIFDIESLLVNLWVAENSGICHNGKEPVAERRDMERQCELGHYRAAPQNVSYNYIHITDDGWKSYEDANAALRTRDATYTKASWYVRPHFATRDEKTYMVKGHYAYRKCAKVDTSVPVVDYIV